MDTETSVLNLGSQAAAALLVLTAARRGLPATARIQAAAARPGRERSASEQLWSDMKQRWLPANHRDG